MATNNMHKKFGENRFSGNFKSWRGPRFFLNAPGPSKVNQALDGCI